jgi:hypothetical protein
MRSYAQTPRQVVVEHFTNTYCSICANKNPSFYSNLQGNYPQVLHIAYHPSSPYAQCYFNKQNVAENDARTKFYKIYGSTPRAVIQGKVIPPSTPLVANSYYDSAINRNAAWDVQVRMQALGTDSVAVTTVVKTTAANSYTVLRLYSVVTESSIAYSANNGETMHYDVFHSQLYAGTGHTFTPAATVGDSVVLKATFYLNPSWTKSKVNVTGLLQDTTTGEVVQAGRGLTIAASAPTGLGKLAADDDIAIYPNPAGATVYFTDELPKTVAVYNYTGALVIKKSVLGSLDISWLTNGIYRLHVTSTSGISTTRPLIISH